MKRGFLIQALLLIALLLVFCLGLLGRQPLAYSGAKQTSKMLQARQLALAGVEDIRVKLERDYQTRQLGQVRSVNYVEDVFNGSETIGSYHVTVNQELQDTPFELLQIECEGLLGKDRQHPESRVVISTLFDLRKENRQGPGNNPNYFRFIEWNEKMP